MKMFTDDKVRQISTEYDGLTERPSYLTMTEWVNGEGWDIEIDHPGQTQKISLTHQDIDVLNWTKLSFDVVVLKETIK